MPAMATGERPRRLRSGRWPGSLASLLVLATRLAWAGPPYATDDPGLTAWGQWEVNLPYILERVTDGRTIQVPLFDIAYGVNRAIELNVTVPLTVVELGGASRAVGLGDTSFDVKWQLRQGGDHRLQLAVAPQVVLPTGDATLGLGAGKPVYVLPVLALKTWGRWAAFGNVGYVLQQAADTRNYVYWGAALIRDINPNLEVGGEIYGNSATEPEGPPDLGFNLGSILTLSPRWGVLLSAGRSVRDGPSLTLYAGLQLALGTAKDATAKPHRASHRHGKTSPW